MNAGPAQMGSLGKFLPKGFIPLRDAIEQLGSELVSGWTGDEQTAEVWEDAQSSSVWKETENWLADQIGQIFMEEWGTTFTQAASDYAQHPIERFSMLELHLTLHKEEIEDLKLTCGDDSIAGGWVIIRIAAKRILEDARRDRLMSRPHTKFSRGLLTSKDSIAPPMMDLGSGPEPIELSEENLNRMEAEANEFFAKREEDRAIIRQRAVEVWGLLRPELHANTYPCVVLNDQGEKSPVPAGVWALPEAEILLRDCAFDEREILVGEAVLSLATPVVGLRRKPGAPNKGARAAAVYDKRFPDGHEAEGLTLQGACNEIAKNDGPTVSPKTLRRALKAHGIR